MQILVKPIGTGVGLNFIEIADAVLDFAENVAEERLQKHGYDFVKNWTNQPGFRSSSDIEGGNLIVSCWPEGNAEAVQHWNWVSRGTKRNYKIYPTAHPGSPRYSPSGKKALAYRSGYMPITSGKGPRVKTEGPGTYSGPWVVTRGPVTHPGIEPRHFEEAWRSWANLWFGPGVQDAINKVKID